MMLFMSKRRTRQNHAANLYPKHRELLYKQEINRKKVRGSESPLMSSRTVDPFGAKTILIAILVCVTGFLVGTLFSGVAVSILVVAGIDVFEQPILLSVVSVITLQGLGFGSVALAYFWFRDDGFDLLMLSMPDLRDFGWIVAGLVGLFLSLISINIVLITLGIDTADHGLIEMGAENPELLLVMVPFNILLVGPAEELLFRGIIQQLLRNRFGVAAGIGLASIIFAGAHASALIGEGVLVTLAIYVALSVILGVSYEYSKNLVVPAMIHGLFNSIQFLIIYLAVTTGAEQILILAI